MYSFYICCALCIGDETDVNCILIFAKNHSNKMAGEYRTSKNENNREIIVRRNKLKKSAKNSSTIYMYLCG